MGDSDENKVTCLTFKSLSDNPDHFKLNWEIHQQENPKSLEKALRITIRFQSTISTFSFYYHHSQDIAEHFAIVAPSPDISLSLVFGLANNTSTKKWLQAVNGVGWMWEWNSVPYLWIMERSSTNQNKVFNLLKLQEGIMITQAEFTIQGCSESAVLIIISSDLQDTRSLEACVICAAIFLYGCQNMFGWVDDPYKPLS